jgi:hypothetical protein
MRRTWCTSLIYAWLCRFESRDQEDPLEIERTMRWVPMTCYTSCISASIFGGLVTMLFLGTPTRGKRYAGGWVHTRGGTPRGVAYTGRYA